jgi:hypothetical protein
MANVSHFEFMQHLSVALHGTLGSYFRDALHEGGVDVVARLHVYRAKVFSLILFFLLRGLR